MSVPLVRLGDVAEFIRGITFKPDDVIPVDAPDAVVCMRTKNVQASLDDSDLIAIPAKFVKRQEQFIRESDILVSSANSWNLIGKCCWVPSLAYRAAAGGFISILRATGEHLDPRYLYHWFANDRTQATLRSFGNQTTNISNLNISRALDLGLPLPPLAEQKRIAAILDAAEALREKRSRANATLGELPRGSFLNMFGKPEEASRRWPTRKLADLLDDDDKINYGIVQPGADTQGGIRLVRVSDLVAGRVDQTNIKRVSSSIEGAYKRSRLKGTELLMSCVGKIGTLALVDSSLGGGNIARAVARIPAATKINRYYLYEYLRQPSVQGYFRTETRTVNQPTLNIREIEQTPVVVPPRELQERFARLTLRIGQIVATGQDAEQYSEKLIQSIVAREFAS